MDPIIAPSLLSADFCRLAEEIGTVHSADWLHVDVMDGQFVSNLTVGMPVVKSLRSATDMFLDVHLMIRQPERYVEPFAHAGADLLSIHLESDIPPAIHRALEKMEHCGVKKGVALRPITRAEAVLPYLPQLDLVLVMTVEPGFGGQAFLSEQLDTIRAVRRYIDALNPTCLLEVDGGIDPSTIGAAFEAGANVFAAGSAVFGQPDRAEAIARLRGGCHG